MTFWFELDTLGNKNKAVFKKESALARAHVVKINMISIFFKCEKCDYSYYVENGKS